MGNDLMKKEENLLKIFIGKNYERITTREFNIPGFFLGTFYMLYRKIYLYGILIFILDLIIINLFNNVYIGLLINLLIALFVNKIYVSLAKSKINKIKNINKDKSDEEIEKICKEKGGTSVLGVVLGFLIELFITGIFIGIAILLFGFNINNYFNKNIENTIVDDDSSEEKHIPGVYDGALYYESNVVLENEFSIVVPTVFTNDSYESHFGYEYENTEETEEFFKTCRLSMNLVMEYTSSNDLIKQMAEFHKDEKIIDVSNTIINNINWNWFAIKNDIGKTYFYATTKNNKVYILSYEVQVGAGTKCEEYREEVINSVKSK